MAQEQNKKQLDVRSLGFVKQATSEANIRAMYRECFNSPAGKVVLEDLMLNFYDSRFPSDHVERYVGQRDVLLSIKEMMTDG